MSARTTSFGRWFAALVASVFVVLSSGAMAAEPIKIGLIAPLTGTVAANGQRIREGAELFVAEINAKGGIEGRPIQLLIDDDRNSPKDAAAIAQKLVGEKNLPLVVGTFSTTASLAIAPILQDAKIPQISPTSAVPDYTRFGPYQFRQNNTETIYAQKNAELLLKRLRLKKIAIVHYQDDWGLTAATETRKALEKAGAKIALFETLLPGGKDFRPVVSKIKALDVDGIYVVSHYGEAAIFIQQVRQAGIALPIAAAQPLTNPRFVELAGKDAEGILVQTTFFAENPASKSFTDAYRAKFGRDPEQWSALAYDSVGVGARAIQTVLKSGAPVTGTAVRDALAAGAPYQGVSGVTKYDENRDVNKDTIVLVIKNGKYVLAD